MTSSQPSKESSYLVSPLQAIVDLLIFLTVMFFIRNFEIESLGFWGNAFLNSVSTVGVATLLLYYRKQSWKTLGLCRPKKIWKMLGIAAIAVIGTIVCIMLFEIFVRDLLPGNDVVETGAERFSEIKGNLPYLLSILPLVWIESFLEELQDRGFSLNRFESLLSKLPISTILAVILQAAVFGYRHMPSHGYADALVVGIIGLTFGIVYVASGRNLWALVIAHCFLNTISMIDRF